MSPPSPATAAAMPDLGANQEGRSQQDADVAAVAAHLPIPLLIREARKVVADLNLVMSGSRLRRLVRTFVREGRSDVDFRTWVIHYADPTGEKAVRNVARERGY